MRLSTLFEAAFYPAGMFLPSEVNLKNFSRVKEEARREVNIIKMLSKFQLVEFVEPIVNMPSGLRWKLTLSVLLAVMLLVMSTPPTSQPFQPFTGQELQPGVSDALPLWGMAAGGIYLVYLVWVHKKLSHRRRIAQVQDRDYISTSQDFEGCSADRSCTSDNFSYHQMIPDTATLQKNKERVDAILNISPDSILLLTSQGTVDCGNPAFYDLFDLEFDEVYGCSPECLFEPGSASRLQTALRKVIDECHSAQMELVACRKDGTTFDTEITLAPICRSGDLEGIVFTLRDIKNLEKFASMKKDFVSDIAHALRTPITSIKLSHYLIMRNPAKQVAYMERLERDIDSLNHIIEERLS